MRIGLDLRPLATAADRLAAATRADRLGLWAVLVGGEPGTEATEAAAIAAQTTDIVVAIALDGRREHPTTLAEELAVVDQLSQRRALAVVDAEPDGVDHVRRLLAGEIVDGVALTPPPAQTRLPVWDAGEVAHTELTGVVEADAAVIDQRRTEGCTHLFVTWPGQDLGPLARHLVTRALVPDFPEVVATWADRVDPGGPPD